MCGTFLEPSSFCFDFQIGQTLRVCPKSYFTLYKVFVVAEKFDLVCPAGPQRRPPIFEFTFEHLALALVLMLVERKEQY